MVLLRSLSHSLAWLVLLTGWASAAEAPSARPNILVFIADDLGFSDLGCYGGEIATPNLDRLAADGLSYSQFYNTSRCWPTRSALLTGYYPQQIRRDGSPGAPRGFGGGGKRPSWAPLISQRLQLAGYRTYHSGKWHIDGKPTDNGFDRSDETTRSPGFFDSLKRADRDPKFYRTIATAEHAVECLQDHASRHADQPFFSYVAFHAPHFPLHALPEDIAQYRERYIEGWDQLRQQRSRRQQDLGWNLGALSPLEEHLGPPYAFPEQIAVLGSGEVNRPLAWSSLTAEQQRFQATKMAIHAAMVHRMDAEIGRVLEQIRQMDALDNTLICFLSDNGASAEIMVRGEGHDPQAPPGSAATYLCLGPGFSSACNTPFRRHKTWVHEGGISTPFIVHWPAGIRSTQAKRSTVAHVIDIVPTIMDVAGLAVEATAEGPALPGASLRGTFDAEHAELHEHLWFYHEGNRALRSGNWKLIASNDTRPFPWNNSALAAAQATVDVDWSLYNLAQDRAEQYDLAGQFPQRVQTMARKWEQLREQFLRDAQLEAGGN